MRDVASSTMGGDAAPTARRDAAASERDAAADSVVDASGGKLDTSVADAPVGGDPEPGRLAGITRAHNQVRAQVSVPPLTWDPAIASTAAAYAAKCIFEHSGTSGLGENLGATAPPGNERASDMVQGWADERAHYDYASNSCDPGETCGHYTQVVWKASTKLGCAVQACNTGSPFSGVTNWEIWVCNYSPRGNVGSQRPY
jgi:uncharacterized protein YkwD